MNKKKFCLKTKQKLNMTLLIHFVEFYTCIQRMNYIIEMCVVCGVWLTFLFCFFIFKHKLLTANVLGLPVQKLYSIIIVHTLTKNDDDASIPQSLHSVWFNVAIFNCNIKSTNTFLSLHFAFSSDILSNRKRFYCTQFCWAIQEMNAKKSYRTVVSYARVAICLYIRWHYYSSIRSTDYS